jgi:hypothetical protein
MRTSLEKLAMLILIVALTIGGAFFIGMSSQAEADSGWKPGVALTAANWGEMVGFKPDLSAGGVTTGLKIKDSNFDQYKSVMPASFETLIKKYKMKMKVVDYKPYHPSLGYIAATNKYAGQPKLVDTGSDIRKRGLDNYTAGMPFPNPKSGVEIAWNYQYSYNGDDGDLYYAVYWLSANSGIETFEEWRWYFIMRTINRTDLEPIPAIDKFKSEGIQYASITYCLTPFDKRGFGALYSRSVNPLNQQGHVYIPASKRVIRNSFGTRGDTWNGTDLLYEDVRGFMGYPEWMNWKLVEKKTLLMPMHAGIKLGKDQAKNTFDMENWPHWNPNMNWELRPVYVVETTPKLPDYPYSKMVFYFDAETSLIVYKEAYDKKGQLWKVILTGYNEPEDMDELPPVYGMQLVIDIQAEHATAFPIYELKTNTNLKPTEFTEANLRKRGR